ncbi:MAG: tetratricopeptide repeat protein [Bacteroidales bacterium]|jgi:tetratricopeptide (TPR) repeat protein|nr:tetratricopeptide repeat protein [Bacteroidales bacterium]
MRSSKILNIALILLLSATQVAYSQKERKYIRSGNDYYKSAIGDTGQVDTVKMKKAAEMYRQAIEKAPTSYEAKYNLANTNFKLKAYDMAEREYKAIQNTIAHDTISAKIFHNLGNSQLMQGKIKESIESYKNALRRNPNDIETKYNLALAQSKLNQMQDQQQQQQNDENQDNQDNQQDQQQQQGQQQQAEEQQAQEQQMQEAEEKEDQQDDKEKYSKEDAARILEALQNEEQNVQERLNRQKKSKSRPKSTRDW